MLVSLRRKLIREPRGQATVEFALVLPILLLLLLGVFEFGRMYNAYLTVQHSAREGVRLGILGATDSEIEARVRANAVTLDSARLTVQISPALGARTSGTIMNVSVTYLFQIVMPVLPEHIGSAIPIVSTLSMRVE